jgi:enoyl-CoA hydratase/carnithine racemase
MKTLVQAPIRVTYPLPGQARIIFDNPPLNLFDPEFATTLEQIVAELYSREGLRVAVFESAIPDFFMAHLDLFRAADIDFSVRPTSGLPTWPHITTRLENAPFVTIGKVRGRARGIGSEMVLAFDMRFASRENAILGQPEMGSAIMPGGGGLERLPLLIGRARALEVAIGGDDFDADTAERYGWVNRALPDAELDAFVDRLAARIASFDTEAIAATKRIINRYGGIPRPQDLVSTERTFFELLERPASRERVEALRARGLNTVGPVELNLGTEIGPDAR